MSNFYDFFRIYKKRPGDIIAMATPTVPTGYLECNGAAVNRVTYAALFTTIGTFFGVGDGSTTFNLPDFRGCFLRCTDDGAGRDLTVAVRTRPGDSTVVGDIPGSLELGSVSSHSHTMQNTSSAHDSNGSGLLGYAWVQETSTPNGQSGPIRPINVNVMFCVKI